MFKPKIILRKGEALQAFSDGAKNEEGTSWGFAVILMLIGATTFSYITATISSVMHDFDVKASMYRSKMANLVRFVKTSNLTKKLSTKLINDMDT